MKNNRLSDALRRGDPADEQTEAQTAGGRKTALLTRCAAEPFTEPARSPLSAQRKTPRKTRWALTALTGAVTAAALYGAAAWFGASNPAPQTVPAQMVQVGPRPSATPVSRETAVIPAPTPRAVPAGRVAARTVERKNPLKRRGGNGDVSKPMDSGVERLVSVKSQRIESALSPTKTLARANRKRETDGPRLIAETTKAPTATALSKLSNVAEPVVERVIIEQDDNPAEPAPTITTVTIAMNGQSKSVVVSRAAGSAAN